MPVHPRQFTDPESQLAAFYASLARRVGQLEASSRRIPILDADPGADDPGNLWAFDDGRLMLRGSDAVVHQFVPTDDADAWPDVPSMSSNPAASTGIDIFRHSSSDELRVRRADGTWARYAAIAPAASMDTAPKTRKNTTDKPKQQQPQPKSYTRTFAATWARSFDAYDRTETGRELHYGRYDGTHGERKVMFGFDDAAIRDYLDGARIVRVRLSMMNLDAYAFSGVRVLFGGHNEGAAPSRYHFVRRGVSSDHWPHTGRGKEWRQVADWFGRNLKQGAIRGLVIDQASGSRALYGAARDDLRIEISVRK